MASVKPAPKSSSRVIKRPIKQTMSAVMEEFLMYINKYRVKEVRLKEGGHDVPEDKIESRYYRSLNLLFNAAQIAYQSYFFDNSGEEFRAFAHFKKVKGKKQWDAIDKSQVPDWFLKYYSAKVKK